MLLQPLHAATVPLVLAIASAAASSTPLFAQTTNPEPVTPIPTRTFIPVQSGPNAPAQEVALYAPGRVLIQVTARARDASDLEPQYQPTGRTAAPVTGIPELDRELIAAGVTDVRRALIDAQNEVMRDELGLDRWYMAEVDARVDIEALSQRLRALDSVQDANPDLTAFPMDVPNDPLHSAHWGHNNTGQMLDFCWGCGGHPGGSPVGTPGFDSSAQAAWDGTQGHGSASVVIAIIDSGVDAGHPDLRQVAGYDYGDNDSNPTDNSAQAGHGTACAGVAAAINGNGIGVAGAAGGCSIMPLKVANSAGSMSFSSIANALIHAADNGADVASLSLGAATTNEPTTSSAITYANNAGVTILAATANSNKSTIDFPANHQLVIGVGAASPCGERKRASNLSSELNPGVTADPNGYTCDGERWWGSNYGPNSQDAAGAVDVIAPTILPTTDIQGSAGYDSGNYSGYFNGTSCATPYAAGVCGLILSKNPGFTPAQVRAQLTSTCDDVTSVESGAGWDRYTGYGMVNAQAAVASGGGGGGGTGPTYASLPYSTGFESGTLDDSWTVALGAEGRVVITTANAPFAGSRHLRMDDTTGNNTYSQNEAALHLDLSGESQVALSFRWKEIGDETHSQDGIYFSSNGGGSYVKVHNLNGGSTTNNTWQLVNLDLDALAASAGLPLSSTFVVKFQQYDNYPVNSDGFAFDEVSVTASDGGGGGGGSPGYANLPYSTGFDTGSLDSYWQVTEGAQGRIRVTTANGPQAGTHHLTMDDSVSGGSYSQNEAWLKLNLGSTSQATLSFRWKHFNDESHTQDGVFISSNGGATFTKIYNLYGGSTPSNSWQAVTLDLDQLAASNGVALTGTFVVKFQQYDNYPISSDGMCIDTVSVN
ncbi:Thermophilic serine proteinase precursor [Planctomycetes bacterium Poly30]|uniref:Thermophilic serine proteinase n=1 Tax=Saltatorellus ferox TaxID=2528018 RepID=A0A518ENB7_9BACT|nr:Thermophilic serine proteinase precursor [Planctomycetes bacterium Poly30]